VTYGERLEPARESLGVQRDRQRDRRVEIPVDSVGNKIKKDGRAQCCQQNREEPVNMLLPQPGSGEEDDPETKIPGNHPGIE